MHVSHGLAMGSAWHCLHSRTQTNGPATLFSIPSMWKETSRRSHSVPLTFYLKETYVTSLQNHWLELITWLHPTPYWMGKCTPTLYAWKVESWEYFLSCANNYHKKWVTKSGFEANQDGPHTHSLSFTCCLPAHCCPISSSLNRQHSCKNIMSSLYVSFLC